MDYDFKKDWRFVKHEIPAEIAMFMESVFQIMEIRQKVGEIHGIKFEIRTREQNHHIPHLHASYDNYSISIAIETGKVLAGNLPKRQQKVAIEWVDAHKTELLEKWNSIVITATSVFTKSRMDTKLQS